MYPLRRPRIDSDGLLAVSWTRIPERPQKSLRAIVAWSAFWAGFAALDVLAPVQFSAVLRDVFKTDTPRGKASFLVALGIASVVFAVHIVK